MAAEPVEITLHLSPPLARRLEEQAERDGTTVEAVAERFISESVSWLPDDPEAIAAMLDAMPGFREQFLESVAQIERGETVPASELRET